jgi:ATP-binding cassette, subfamily B, bacterial
MRIAEKRFTKKNAALVQWGKVPNVLPLWNARMAANNAFARCQRFLNYSPTAKWCSIIASVGSAVLYGALIVLLGFFIDLTVKHGEIPSYSQLSSFERAQFLNEIALPADADKSRVRRSEIVDELHSLGIDQAQVKNWAGGDPIAPPELAVLWWADVLGWLKEHVGADAADRVREELKHLHEGHGVEDVGVLGLAARSRHNWKGVFLAAIARWNPWMWEQGNNTYLVGLFLLALGISAVRVVLMFVSKYLAAVAVLEAVTRLRRAVYHHTNRLGSLAFQAHGPSEAVSVSTRHLEGVHDGLFQWLTVYFREPVKFGLLLAFTFLINFWLAVAFLLFAVLVWLIGGQTAAYFRAKGRQADLRSADHLVLIQESLMLMRLVKIYLMETFNQARVERQLRGYAKAQLQRYSGDAFYRSAFFFLGLLAALLLLLVAGYVVLTGQLSVTSSLVLAGAIISLYWPTLRFLEARRVVRRCRSSAHVVFHFLDRPGGVGQAIEASFIAPMSKQLQFDKVSLSEAGTGRKLLSNVSFTIRAGERIALVGPDETEKHALVYLLTRFLDPAGGEIRIDGKNLRWVTLDSLRAQIAMVLQNNLVFNDTILNNIGCGDPTYNSQRVTDAAKIAHAHQFISKLPLGYETVIGELGHPLKLGEQFRIAIARAILRDPAILVIEEPFEPLDEDTKAMIDDTFQRILPTRTVIFLPHRLSTLRGCDQIFLLYQGQIESSGEHRDLLASSDLYRHLQYMEFNEFAGVGAPVNDGKASE